MKKLLLMSAALLMASSVCTLVACNSGADKKTYTVTFDSDGGTAVEAQTLQKGKKVLLVSEPTKESDNTYSYAFDGWYNGETLFDFEKDTVSGDMTLKAKWTPSYINYTVIFANSDGTELLKKEDYHYGDTIAEPESNPLKEEDKYQTYSFDGWGADIATVTGNVTYTAKFAAVAKEGYNTKDVEVNGEEITLKAGALKKEGGNDDGRLIGGNYNDDSVDQAYFAFDGEFGKDSYVAFDFTGKNFPILAFFAKNYNQSMYTGPLDTENNGRGSKEGVVILTGLTNNDGELVQENPNGSTYMWDGTGLLQCGPDMVYWTDRESGAEGYYYGTNPNAPVHARLGKDGKNSALGRANLVDDTHYRVVIGNSFNGASMSTNYYLYNLDTNEIVETKSYETWGHFTDQFCHGSAEEYLTGSIVMYGYFGVDTVIDKVYPVFEHTTASKVAGLLGMTGTTNKVTMEGDKMILGAGTLGEGAELKGNNDSKVVDQAYYAFDGNFGKNSYVTLEFTGKNMPNIAFFAKDYDKSMYSNGETKEGVTIITGLTNADGTLYAEEGAAGSTDIHDGKGILMCGPYMTRYTDREDGNHKRLAQRANSALARANLEDGKKYRVVIGMKTGSDARALSVEYYLYNMTDNKMVEVFELQSYKFFNDTFCVTEAGGYFTGDIVLYGQFGTTVTLDKVYEVATNTTLQAVVESYGMTYDTTNKIYCDMHNPS